MVKAKLFDENGKNVVSISFETCQVQGMQMTGVVLKRLKGDTWAYKKLTESLLAQMRF